MIPVRAINTYIGVLDLYSFVLVHSLRMALQYQNMQELILFMN